MTVFMQYIKGFLHAAYGLGRNDNLNSCGQARRISLAVNAYGKGYFRVKERKAAEPGPV